MKEALKLALEAFDSMIGRKPERVEQAITAIKAALAQPAQKDCGCAECGKKEKDGWYLYCVECMSKTALAQPAQHEVVDFALLFREAEKIVQYKPTWKRFIEGTPLANDIAVWMTVFAQDVARRTTPQRPWVGLTEEDLKLLSAEWRIVYGAWMDDFAQDIEAKLKEKNT